MSVEVLPGRPMPVARIAGDYVRLIPRVSKKYDALAVSKDTHLDAHLAALQDAQPLTVRCAFCTWSTSGTAREAREKAAQHRREAHPQVKPEKRKRKDAGKPMWQQAQEDRENGKVRDTSGLST